MPEHPHYENVDQALYSIHQRLDTLINGNGRKGINALLDDFYGDREHTKLGVIARVVLIEKEIEERKRKDARREWIQIGIAIGMGVVILDTVVGVDIASLVARMLGAG